MSKMQRHQQEALWEFVHTELSYINKLVIIKDVILYIQSQFRFDRASPLTSSCFLMN